MTKTTANEVSLFKFKDAEVRVVRIDGQPWFAGSDVLTFLLGRSRGNGSAYLKLSESEKTKVDRINLGLAPGKSMVLISESGLYKLVMRSDKPEAKDFQNWVTRVVLPAIRKDGGYIQGEEHVVSGAMSMVVAKGCTAANTGKTEAHELLRHRLCCKGLSRCPEARTTCTPAMVASMQLTI
ncbi:MAG: hypothetical protein K0M49_01580 [Arenimonas sp.]|nr:BRO family protein [Rhizobium sp.]MBW8444296.1 hypothetical protein [Arenimonas sp.]